MCRFVPSRDEHISSDNQTYFLHDEDEEIDEVESTTQYKIPRSIITGFIQSLRQPDENDSFITPNLALKVIDFCHLLISRTQIRKEDRNRLVHKWYNIKSGQRSSIPFNQRVKNIEEIMDHLIADCELKKILID